MEPKGESPGYSEELKRQDREEAFDHIYKLGQEKPIGYLPIRTITDYYGENLESVIQECRNLGYSIKLFAPAETHIGGGALFSYDETALQKLLDSHPRVLEEFQWPVNADKFVDRVASEMTRGKTALYDLISDAFGDKSGLDPQRTDVS